MSSESTTREQVERAAAYYRTHHSEHSAKGIGYRDRYVTTPDGTEWIVWRTVPVFGDGASWHGHTVRAADRLSVGVGSDDRDRFARLLDAASEADRAQ